MYVTAVMSITTAPPGAKAQNSAARVSCALFNSSGFCQDVLSPSNLARKSAGYTE